MAVKLGTSSVTLKLGTQSVTGYLGSAIVTATVPGAPTGLAASGSGSLYFNFPESDGGSPITGYRVYADQNDPAYEDVSAGFIRQENPPFLFNEAEYDEYWTAGFSGIFNIKVSAVNAVGEGPLSQPLAVDWT
jgi:hypothetical protein